MIDTQAKYSEVRDDLKSGDSVLWAGTSPIAKLIQWRTGSRWSHVSTVVRLVDMGIDRVFITEALTTGIVFFPLSRRIRNHAGDVCWLPLNRGLEANRDGVRRWAMRKVGRPYDFESLFAQVFRRVSADSRAMFCSEFDFMAKRDGGGIPALADIRKAPYPSELFDLGIFDPGCQILKG